MRAHFDDVRARLTAGGAKLDVVACPPGFDEITAPFQVLMNVGAAAHHAKLCADSAELVGADARRTVVAGQQVSAVDYAAALRRQRELRVTFDAALRGYDAVLMPAATGTAPAGIKTGNPVMQIPWSFLGFPALTLPTGLGRDGLPLGTQLVAVPARENDLIAAAAWCEQRVGVVARPAMAAEDD
jgi:Asp-tRNA(Asn)/Glu-tRNA(Gln) amidotransferase A subunit family amidase